MKKLLQIIGQSPMLRTHILWGIAVSIVFVLGMIIGVSIKTTTYIKDLDDGAEYAKCIRVLDGDTIEVIWLGNTERVRILGIDAPETRRGRSLTSQADLLKMDPEFLLRYGNISTKIVENWLLNRPVRLIFPGDEVKRDSFGRLLCYVEQQGLDIGERMLLGGNAIIYESQHPRMETYQLFQAEAQKQRRGIWRNL